MLSRGKNHRETAIISRTSSPFNFQLSCDTCAAHTTSIENARSLVSSAQRKKEKSKKPNFNRKTAYRWFFPRARSAGNRNKKYNNRFVGCNERLGYTLVQACARAPRSSFAQSVLRIVPIAGQIKRDTGVYTSYIASFLWTRDHEAWILLLNVSRVASRFASSCKPAHPVLSRVQHRKIAIRQSAYRPPSRSTMLSLAMLIEKCTLQCNRMIESYNSHCMNIPRENWIDNKDWSID